MANRYMQQFMFSFNHMLTMVEGSVSFGSSGAVGTVKGSGVKSVTKDATGKYTIKLEDNYARFLNIMPMIVSASNSGIAAVEVCDASVQAHVADGTGIQVCCYDKDGAAASPAQDAVLYFAIMLRNSSVKGKGE